MKSSGLRVKKNSWQTKILKKKFIEKRKKTDYFKIFINYFMILLNKKNYKLMILFFNENKSGIRFFFKLENFLD